MDSFSYIKNLIIEAMHTYQKTTNKKAGYVDLTSEMEYALYRAEYKDVGALLPNLTVYGARSTFKNLFGLTVTWDASEFKVYGDDMEPAKLEGHKLDFE
jgi:hypothetical protein